jgi:hypothetical protein
MLRGAPWSIQQDVVPDDRVEVLDRFQNKSGIFDLAANPFQLSGRPETILGISGDSPIPCFAAGRLIVAWIFRTRAEVVDQMDHDMRTAGLARKVIGFARQHMPI